MLTIERVSRALRYTDSIMERATLIAVVLKIPGSAKVGEIVAAASGIGGGLDDCFDKIDRRQVNLSLEGERPTRVRRITNTELWGEYVDSWRNLIGVLGESSLDAGQKKRVLDNCITFFRNIRTLELQAISLEEEDWSKEKAIEYRKVICLMWAELFSSISPDSELKLQLISSADPKEVLSEHKSILDGDERIQSLYYGAIAYQLVCDWTGKSINNQHFIPGLGSLGSQNIKENEAWATIRSSISEAVDKGVMSPIEAVACEYLLPPLRRLANRCLVDSNI